MLRNKDLAGVSKPLSLVEEVLCKQGFKRKGSKEQPVFRMNMQDAATTKSYALDIPFKEDERCAEPNVRLGTPYVSPTASALRTGFDDHIPQSVYWAAESKIAEVVDYLTMYDHK
ncbi:hypothetical protein [Aneurinibacillus terranovensis]|uniref:hypothetical protein n=1 Tax=Aneurinibacillus terranovensis TaxID=278991 RepID=UPI0004122BE2|nr:hypothetical protein [Aneurinibacillus terranovensis]